MLRLIKSKNNGFVLTNICGLIMDGGSPMVGSKYCKQMCPHCAGITKIMFWKFIKCTRSQFNQDYLEEK